MKRLSPDQLKSRLRFDFEVCQRIFGNVFSGEAYRYNSDLERRINPILAPTHGHLALKYRVDFYVKTLIGPGQFTHLTTIGFDLEVGNYPYEEPVTWLISKHAPYSPHFKRGAPVCIGKIWKEANGRMLLGELLVYIARLLNWDSRQSVGYSGWNEDATRYHRQVYGGRAISEIVYPVLPADLIYGLSQHPSPDSSAQTPLFRPSTMNNSTSHPDDTMGTKLFRGRGIENEYT